MISGISSSETEELENPSTWKLSKRYFPPLTKYKSGFKAPFKLPEPVNVYSDEFYILAGSGGDLGIAEAYAAGYWDADDMVKLIQIVIKNKTIIYHYNTYN